MNVFADLTQDEYRQKALGYRPDLAATRPLKRAPFVYENTVPPKEVDWLKEGVVTPVRWAWAGWWGSRVVGSMHQRGWERRALAGIAPGRPA